MRPRVLVIGDETKGHVRSLVDEFTTWLRRGAAGSPGADVVGVDLSRDSDLSRVTADLVVAFGGDGTILGAARRMGRNQIPTLGINLGKLGFLTEIATEHAQAAVTRALAGEMTEEPRMLLQCYAESGGMRSGEALALNDAVVMREASASIIRVAACAGGRYVTTYSGDGLIVASPVGSTAYSMSAGGPILAPDMDALVMTPLAPHSVSVRPLVVHAREGVTLALEGSPRGVLVIDGQVRFDLTDKHRVVIKPADVRFRLLVERGRSFFEILREKFGWAGSPKYADRK